MDVLCSWHPWPVERAWPLRYDEEATFAAALADAAAGRTVCWSRSDLTAVVTALRQGVTADQLQAAAPGRDPAALHAAYHAADRGRRRATDALTRLLNEPTMGTLATDGPTAARLLPRPVRDLLALAHHTAGAANQLAAAKIRTRTVEAAAAAADLERHVAALRLREDAADRARQLFHPHQPCAWSHAYFVPARVGELTPVRLASVLELHPDVCHDRRTRYDQDAAAV